MKTGKKNKITHLFSNNFQGIILVFFCILCNFLPNLRFIFRIQIRFFYEDFSLHQSRSRYRFQNFFH